MTKISDFLWDVTHMWWYSKWKDLQLKRILRKKFGGRIPDVGDTVCDCRYRHLKITRRLNADDIILEDGSMCSLYHCCSPADHVWNHPTDEEMARLWG
jgi:hypothetical protein